MEKFNLNFNYIKTVIFRVLPNVTYDFKKLNTLFESKTIKSYFKGVRKLQEYPSLFDKFETNGFDMSLASKVRDTIQNTKQIFNKNLNTYILETTDIKRNKYMCGIYPEKLTYLSSKLIQSIFRVNTISDIPKFSKPTIDELLIYTNKSASIGLPSPFTKKRQVINELKSYLEKFYNQKLKLADIFTQPSATFMRSQIRTSDLKIRLVHAVEVFQQSLESYYYHYFVSSLPKNSCLCIGLTQSEVSEVVKDYDSLYTYCFDAKSWDHSRQPVLSVISFEIIRSTLPLGRYEDWVLKSLRNYFLTLPAFHPNVPLLKKQIGVISGSGFTTLDNSLSNYIFIELCVFDYCKVKGIDPNKFTFKINVLGDDLVLGTDEPFDYKLFISLAFKNYGVTLKLECEPVLPGQSKVFFLGSEWVNGKPIRPESLMVASVIFGSGNFPMMTDKQLFQSRFIEIFGNSSDTSYYWKRFNEPLLDEFFFFNELTSPFKFNSKNSPRMVELEKSKSSSKIDPRGTWFKSSLTPDSLSNLWTQR